MLIKVCGDVLLYQVMPSQIGAYLDMEEFILVEACDQGNRYGCDLIYIHYSGLTVSMMDWMRFDE